MLACEKEQCCHAWLKGLHLEYQPTHISTNLENHITRECQDEMDRACLAVHAELEWDLRSFSDF